jgi:hypothetical protein
MALAPGCQDDATKVIKLSKTGLGLRGIARKLGMAASSVHSVLKSAGCETRGGQGRIVSGTRPPRSRSVRLISPCFFAPCLWSRHCWAWLHSRRQNRHRIFRNCV